MTRIVVRPFAVDEWHLYKKLRLRALLDSPQAFAASFERENARPDTDWINRLTSGVSANTDYPLLALHQRRSAGMVWGKTNPTDENITNVYQMWVDERYRGRGVGAALLRGIQQWAVDKNCKCLELKVAQDNLPAIRFYQGFGFIKSDLIEEPDLDGVVNLFVMMLPL